MNFSPLIIFSAMLIYGLLHSVLAAARAKALARRWFGPQADRWYRLFFNVVGFFTLLPVLALPSLLPDAVLYRVPPPWLYLALGGQAAAVLMLLHSLRQTDTLAFLGLRQLLASPEAHGQEKLIVSGLYRWVRHPLYSASLLFIWLTPVMTLNWLALFIGATIYFVVGAMYEERKLVNAYGKEYEAYRRRTPMLIPGLKWGK